MTFLTLVAEKAGTSHLDINLFEQWARNRVSRIPVAGPWLLATIANRLNRDSRDARWEDIDAIQPPEITLTVSRHDLEPPTSVPLHRDPDE